MSNVIKASTINYKQDVRTLDMNARADEITNRYVNDYYNESIASKHQISFDEVSKKLEDQKVVTQEDMDFIRSIQDTKNGFSD